MPENLIKLIFFRMRIFAVGRNYAEHIKELNNERPEEPVIFTKPDTALLKNNSPFFYPDFSRDIHHEVELVLRICKEGKNIGEKFASRYFDAIGIGIDFTARDLQQKAKEKGLPWDIAKGFNGSAPLSDKFIAVTEFKDLKDINFRLTINGGIRQQGNTNLMIFSFEYIISYLSRFFTLRTGDLIFTGTPKGVGPVQAGDTLAAYIENEKLLEFEVR
jgi:2-keto-4-pentenoate hydratase/2-oxohepta-3-ene-1,7-dioic acid hydratase in catechol pathway